MSSITNIDQRVTHFDDSIGTLSDVREGDPRE